MKCLNILLHQFLVFAFNPVISFTAYRNEVWGFGSGKVECKVVAPKSDIDQKVLFRSAGNPRKSATCKHSMFKRMRRAAFITIIAASVIQSGAVEARDRRPDKFTEALVYAGYAEDNLRCRDKESATNDPLAEAEKWTLRAIKTAREFRTEDRSRQERAASFITDQSGMLETIRKWEKILKGLQREVEDDLREGKLMTAEGSVTGDSPLLCYPFVKQLQGLVLARRRVFEGLVQQGDALTGAAALRKYRAALQMNREDKELQAKIQNLSETQ